MNAQLFLSTSTDVHRNLALEEALAAQLPQQTIALYLWQNADTVVIGRNQNAWKECDVAALQQAGGTLARRKSGGGAVFHDLQNLNFTFLLPKEQHDFQAQAQVVCRALARFGVVAEVSGRNDITVGGAKCSGNAFSFTERVACHHGTLLIKTDMDKLSRFLKPSPLKLQAKGVGSVRARVVNLSDCDARITPQAMKEALIDAFEACYGPISARFDEAELLQVAGLDALYAQYASSEFCLGQKQDFDWETEARLPFGLLQLGCRVSGGRISHCEAYSDALDTAWTACIAPALLGADMAPGGLSAAVRACRPMAAYAENQAALAAFLEKKGL